MDIGMQLCMAIQITFLIHVCVHNRMKRVTLASYNVIATPALINTLLAMRVKITVIINQDYNDNSKDNNIDNSNGRNDFLII